MDRSTYPGKERWTGQHILEKKECAMYYSCHNKRHHLGRGFIINKDMKHLIMDFQSIRMRLCKLRVRGRFCNYSIFSAHAPTEEKDTDEKDAFYDVLEKGYDKCPKHDIKLTFGIFQR
jgi:hypothetical protein